MKNATESSVIIKTLALCITSLDPLLHIQHPVHLQRMWYSASGGGGGMMKAFKSDSCSEPKGGMGEIQSPFFCLLEIY